MKTFLSSLLLVAVGACIASAAPEDDFAACVKATGTAYLAAREKLLAVPPPAAFLDAKANGNEWDEQLTAIILKGWQKNAARYKQLLAANQITDQKGVTRYEWAVTGESIQPSDVPLMLELLIKDPKPDDAWNAALGLVRMAEGHGDAVVYMPQLHQFFQQAEFVDSTQRLATAWLLGNLPFGFQESQEDKLLNSLKAELSRKDSQADAIESLLLGLARAAQNMKSLERNKLVDSLTKLEALRTKLGDTLLTHAVGNIGGDQASKQVALHLDGTSDVIEKQWALATLGRANSEIGTAKLLDYADNQQLELRDEAIRSLARAPLTNKSIEKLVTFATQENDVKLQRRAALSLAAATKQNKGTPMGQAAERELRTVTGKMKKNSLQKDLQSVLDQLGQGN